MPRLSFLPLWSAEEKDSLSSPSDKKIIVPLADTKDYTFTVKGEGGAIIPTGKLELSCTDSSDTTFTANKGDDYDATGAIKLTVGTLGSDRAKTNSIVITSSGYAPVTIPVTVKQKMKVTLSTDASVDVNTTGTIAVTLTGETANLYTLAKADGDTATALTDLEETKTGDPENKFAITLDADASTVSIKANEANAYPTEQATYKVKAFGYDEVTFNRV